VKSVYQETLRFRRRYYSGPNPLTASSIAGLAIWGYESVRLGLTDDADADAVLGEALEAAFESMAMRRATSIPGDISKSATMLVKLGALQSRYASIKKDKPNGTPHKPIVEAVRELDIVADVVKALGATPAVLRDLGLAA
jgi:hypothetical protein